MMNYKTIGAEALLSKATSTKSVFLCGNGFSINFDDNYKSDNLANRLFETHCHLKKYSDFDVISNGIYKTIFTENFKAAKKILGSLKTRDAFNLFFQNAYDFAYSIIGRKATTDWLESNGYNTHLRFGLCQLDLVRSIVEQANKNGILYVNYEYWTVLIYYVLALSTAPTNVYNFDSTNVFVSAVKSSGMLSLLNEPICNKNIFSNVAANGVFTYFRFLFTANILLDGKSYNVNRLSNWSDYCIASISDFLSNFKFLLTTNYDKLLENITGREVEHLHGTYLINQTRVLYLSLGVFYNRIRYDLTTAVIGDYFLSKSFLQVVAKTVSTQKPNSEIEIYSDILRRVIKEDAAQTIVIFGLNMDNDLHILRDIQMFLGSANIKDPSIIYCYYCDNDKQRFLDGYEACITYSNQLSNYVRNNIEVSMIDSKEIIEKMFVRV